MTEFPAQTLSGSGATLISETVLASAVDELCRRDRSLAAIVDAYGIPPLWAREPGFGTLVHIILEQQVSLASARAAYHRLRQLVSGDLTPERFLTLDDEALKGAGFSRQKTGYARGLAEGLASGMLDLSTVAAAPDDEALEMLVAIKGIGPWSAQIYLLMALGRPDIWPLGDRALAVAAQHALALEACPRAEQLSAIGASWMPWRSVAARVLWHYYLSKPLR
jgi:DNA-3-methyladenine glycosylase II